MSKRLLIVDDELFVRELLQEMCSGLGYDACTAGSKSQLEALLTRYDFSAAIVDLRLADCLGLELIALLRDKAPDLAIILMTGYPNSDDLIAAMRLGVGDCIIKPFRRREIEGIIARACADTTRRSEIRSLRERVAELETRVAGSARKSSRRLVISSRSEIADGALGPLEFIEKGLSDDQGALSSLSMTEDSGPMTDNQKRRIRRASPPYASSEA
jgi:DNA-binding NtrC family response regulator